MCYVKSQHPPIHPNLPLPVDNQQSEKDAASFLSLQVSLVDSLDDMSWLSGFPAYPVTDNESRNTQQQQHQQQQQPAFDLDDSQLFPWLTETIDLSSLASSDPAAFLAATPLQLAPPTFKMEPFPLEAIVKVEQQQPSQIFTPVSLAASINTPMTSPISMDFYEPMISSPLYASTLVAASSKKRPTPVSPAEDEDLAVKRMKNTEAARRSRARKSAKLETLQQGTSVIQEENTLFKMKIAVLENEHLNCAAREKALLDRILKLEMQLAESHRAMLQLIQK